MEYTGFEVGGYDEDAYQTKVDFAAVPPDASAVKYFATTRNDVTKRSEDKKASDLSSIIGTMGVKMPPSNSELTQEHISKAKLAYAAKLGADEGGRYLAHNGINKTVVDSSPYGLMLRDSENGKYTLALRGMRPTDPRDILNVSRQTSGTHESLKIANTMLDKVINDGGVVEHISGFSMGGADALDLGMSRGIDVTAFDAPINPRHVLRNSLATRSSKATINLVRNPENFISINSGLRNVSLFPQYKVTNVPVGESGVFSNHELMPNFIRPQIIDAEATAINMVKVANRFAQHETLLDMKRTLQVNGSFTDFHRELNSRGGEASNIDVDVDGVFNKLGVRVNENAPLVKLWRLVGGQFNQFEQEHLSNTTSSPATQDIMADDDVVKHIQDGDLDVATFKSQERFTNGMAEMNANETFSHPAVKSSVNTHIRNAVHPVNMMTGMLSAFAGESVMGIIDPSGSFGQYNEKGVLEHTGVSGSFTGAFSDILMNGMAGGSGLVSEAVAGLTVSAGLGAVTGEATRYLVDKELDAVNANDDTRESVSNLSGGFVGGATVSLSSDAMAIASASLTGAELGELGGPAGVVVGAGVGALFGLGAYGLAKLNQVPAVKKVEKNISAGVLKDFAKIKSWF